MVATFNNFTMIKDHNNVTVHNGGETVGDDENGTAFHQFVHAALNDGFCSGINGRRSFVQNHDRRIRYGSTGDGQKLPLTRRVKKKK